MKGMIGLALASAFVLAVAPAIAGDTFHAFSSIPPAACASLAPLSDDQLATVQGREMFVDRLMLMQILNPLFGIVDPAIIASGAAQASAMSTQSTSSVSQTQQNSGGNVQTNIVQIRQR